MAVKNSTSSLDQDLAERGPLKKLYSKSLQDGLIFPGNIKDLEHFAVFRIRDRKFDYETLQAQALPATVNSRSVFLPMPPQLSAQYGVSYRNQSLGLRGAAATAAVGGSADIAETVSSLTNASSIGSLAQQALGEGVSALLNLSPDIADVFIEGTGRAVAESENPLVQGAFLTQNVAVNPYQVVFFESPNFRTFNFSYELYPRNPNESEIIKNIIKEFKKAMLPSYASDKSFFFEYPKVFDIEFRHDEYLFEIGTSVMTSFDVNYHPNGTPSYFDLTKAPTGVTISMAFQELNILTRQDVEGDQVGFRR